jgi:hypothetical protein
MFSVVLSLRGLTGPLISTLLASRTRKYGAFVCEVTGDSIGLEARAIVRPIPQRLTLRYRFDSIQTRWTAVSFAYRLM